jgi:hypothetical protein
MLLGFMAAKWYRAFGIVALLIPVTTGVASADESPFAAIYTTEILPAGGKEIEQWLTWEHGRPSESWDHLAGRTELEYGVTNDFQLAGYLNYDYFRVRPDGPDARDAAADGLDFTSGSIEAIYRITDPYTQPVGVALYLEPGYGPDTREIEAKILLDSHFLDDRLVLAINGVLEYEWARAGGGEPFERATELTVLVGASYRFAPGFSAGLEFEAKREGDGLLFGEAFHPAADSFRIGPTVHYAQDNWWVTLGYLAQLPTAGNLNGEPGEVVGVLRMKCRATVCAFALG